jgi:hypothetical protein
MRSKLLCALIAGAAAVGCKEKPSSTSAPAQPTPAASQPSAAAPAPAPATASSQPAQPAAAAFSGEITVSARAGKDAQKETDVLFLMARESAGGKPGRLLATQRHVKVTFPFHFEMSSKDVMVPGSPFSGPFIVNARLDRDGDPMTKGPDDLYAEIPGEVKGGETTLKLELAPQAAPQ